MPNGCQYCGKQYTDFSKHDGGIEMYIDENEYGEPVISVEVPYEVSIPINFCPFCGRKLIGDGE